MNTLKSTNAGIDYFTIGPDDADIAVILCHGYGADAGDLAPLSSVLKLQPATQWIFPNGPLRVPIGPHMMGHAWFPIDMEALVQAQIQGTHRDLSTTQPTGLIQRGQQLAAFIDQLGLKDKKLVLGGFSQGAMLATETLFHLHHRAPDALVLLSGALLDRNRWLEEIGKLSPIPFFMSHGSHDPLLTPAGSRELQQALVNHGWPGNLIEFAGGHEIPQMVLSQLQSFLEKMVQKWLDQ